MAEALARRYGEHPALALWHVDNEYACHVTECFCDASVAAFRDWLRARYGFANIDQNNIQTRIDEVRLILNYGIKLY